MRPRRACVGLAAAAAASLLFATPAHAGDRAYSSASAVEPLAPGAKVPSVEVETLRSEPQDLAALVRDAGALLVFFRGGW